MKKLIILFSFILITHTLHAGWDPVGLGGLSFRVNEYIIHGTKLYAAVNYNEGDVFYSNNLGPFTNISTSLSAGNSCHSVAAINDLVFGYFSGGFFVTTNNGAGWTQLNLGDSRPETYLPDSEDRAAYNILKTFNNKLYYGLKVSADSGITWTTLNNGIIPNKTPVIFYFSDTLFLGVYVSQNTGVIYRSTNQGALWTPTSFTLPVSTGETLGPAYFYKNKIYLGGGTAPRPTIYTSTNGGANFNYLSSVPGRSYSRFVGYQNLFFCGTDSSIMLSRNDGLTWENISEELQSTQETPGVGNLKIYQNTHILLTHSERGIQKRLLSELTAIGSQGNGIATGYELSQNYPNPFNPSTTINYYIPRREIVTITIYSSSGLEIAQIENGNRASGLHTINFDASKLSSGVYFYRIQAGEFTETKKMLLVK